MKLKIFFTVVLLSQIVQSGYTQSEVGYKFDLNGYAFNGYYNPFTYIPKLKLSLSPKSSLFENGRLYTKQGKKIEGRLKLEKNKVLFKPLGLGDDERVNPEDYQSFVIGADSFFVIQDFYINNSLKSQPEFVQYITSFNSYTVAKYYQSLSSKSTDYIIKANKGINWVHFPNNKSLSEKILKYFDFLPNIEDIVAKTNPNKVDLFSIIKMAEYYFKFENKELIYYDKYWQELTSNKGAKYSAFISNIADLIWTIEYFDSTTKLYEANYSSFYPNIKDGQFLSYYPNGVVRQIIDYKDNLPKKVNMFNSTGDTIVQYEYKENRKSNSEEEDYKIIYHIILDSLGQNLIQLSNNFQHNVFDSISEVTYTNVYNNRELVKSYRLLGSDTVFQILEPEFEDFATSMHTQIDEHIREGYYKESLKENAQGIVLVNFVIDKKGYLIDYSLLNKIHPEVDRLVTTIVINELTHMADSRYRFTPYKRDKVKRYFEFVAPFDFSIHRSYKKPHNPLLHNQYYFNQMNSGSNTYMAPVRF